MPKELIDDDCGRTSNCSCPRVRRAIGSMSGTPILNRAVLTGVVFVLHLAIAWNLLFQEIGARFGTVCWRRLIAWQKAGV
jgi:transposase